MGSESETFGLIKPDGIKRGKTPSIIAFIMQNGFRITEAKWVILTPEEAEELCPYHFGWLEVVGNKVIKNCTKGGIDPKTHFGSGYDSAIALGKIVRQWNVSYLSEKPVCFRGIKGVNGNTPEEFRKFVGETDEWDKNTVRGLFRDPEETIVRATIEQRTYQNVIHVPDPERIAFEKAIILGAKAIHVIKPEE